MELQRRGEKLEIRLGPWERLWSFHVGETITVPLGQIQAVGTTTPPADPWMIRAPGTGLPGILAAGTFYSRRGREFWYVTSAESVLVLDVADFYYKRLVLNVAAADTWARLLSAVGNHA
ncbi:MAG TPA: hypothetical protein DCQ32_00310 [Cyanobacteria bacterium UBA8156]|jgi:hypothetical protein|nr:hypothetical protein [Cyanobacteria bacterium UBA8156]